HLIQRDLHDRPAHPPNERQEDEQKLGFGGFVQPVLRDQDHPCRLRRKTSGPASSATCESLQSGYRSSRRGGLSIDRKRRRSKALVSRFRSLRTLAAASDANFGIKETLDVDSLTRSHRRVDTSWTNAT